MTDPAATDPAAADPPLLRVVSGSPDADELAALVAVLCSRPGSGSLAAPSTTASAWAAPVRQIRAPLHPGRDAWRRSALPS